MFENTSPVEVAIIVMVYSLIADFTFRPWIINRRVRGMITDPEVGRGVVVGLLLGLADLIADPRELEVFAQIVGKALGGLKGAGKGLVGWAPKNLKDVLALGIAQRMNLLPHGPGYTEEPHEGGSPAPGAQPPRRDARRQVRDQVGALRDAFRGR